MPNIVVKFGGSNFRNNQNINKLINLVKAYRQPLVIVVSAFHGVTDYLVENLKKAGRPEFDAKSIIGFLSRSNHEVIEKNIRDPVYREAVHRKVFQQLEELERYLLGINYIGEVPDFLEDLILSYGERLSALTLTALFKHLGLNCELVLPEEMGLITDGEFGNASVDFEASAPSIKERLSGEKNYVIPGFYGISKAGKITLFGRGGSDYSAASIARCIEAKSLDIWKDVNGFLSGDPKLVKNPIRLEKIAYAEAAELAYFGAKILHPRTVEPLMDFHIPIRIFNINGHLESFKPLSIVNSEEMVRDGVVKSVTYNDHFSILKLKGPGVGIKPGILAKVTTCLNNKKINITSVITSQIAINLLLSQEDLKKAYAIIKDLGLSAVSEIIAIDNISIIAVVGLGMLENHGIAARLFSALARKGINVKISCSGASQVVSYFIVDHKNRTIAVREIHKEFFEKS